MSSLERWLGGGGGGGGGGGPKKKKKGGGGGGGGGGSLPQQTATIGTAHSALFYIQLATGGQGQAAHRCTSDSTPQYPYSSLFSTHLTKKKYCVCLL